MSSYTIEIVRIFCSVTKLASVALTLRPAPHTQHTLCPTFTVSCRALSTEPLHDFSVCGGGGGGRKVDKISLRNK